VTGLRAEVRSGPRREGDPPTLTADARAIAADLGWRAKVTELDEIIGSAWRWFRGRRWPGGEPMP
jgi:UDP-glucose 4-epimerase